MDIDKVQSPPVDVGGDRNPNNQDTYEPGDDNPNVTIQPSETKNEPTDGVGQGEV